LVRDDGPDVEAEDEVESGRESANDSGLVMMESGNEHQLAIDHGEATRESDTERERESERE
jgi:hypothetical protein